MSKKVRVSGFDINNSGHKEIQEAADRIGISIPTYVRIKALEMAKKENKKAEQEE